VLPKFDPNSEEHFFHIYGFLEHLARSSDIFPIIERVADRTGLPRVNHVYAQRFGFPLRAVETLAAMLAARVSGYRIFYVHYSFVGALCAGAVARLSGGRAFYWHCGLATLFFRPWALTRQALAAKFGHEIPLRLSLRAVHSLVTGTPGMADYYAREFGLPRSRIVVLPNDIDLSRFADLPGRTAARAALRIEQPTVVLFLHRLSPRKGAELLPAIMARVAAARPDVLFLIAGDGPSRSSLEQTLAEGGLLGHARLMGWVPNQRVGELYAASDLFIMPSLEEGFPRVLLEAMAAGTPFVASDVGGVREMCAPEQLRWLVPAGDAERFADAAVECLGQEDGRLALAAAGREHVRRYDTALVGEMFRIRIIGEPV
jgi:glycosyltransferase involved in cell wall biosynthesis